MANSFNPNDNFGPGGKGGYGAPLEDLNIIVNLTAQRKPKTIINSSGSVDNTPVGSIQIPDGSNIGGEKWLTTNYTQLNTVFNKSGANVEGLGINSVNIEFNSSYTPMISISMTDVRGSSVFAAGNDSNYSIFFDLPYPIFSLEVKGPYGQAVRYCLHLTKFTTKFNSQTGNFDINCDFIGYTYAFLSDMLIGYLRANVYTSWGESEFNQYAIKFYADFGFELPTIDDYFDQVNLLGTVLQKVRQDSVSGKMLVNINERLRLLDVIAESVKTATKNLVANYDVIVDTKISVIINSNDAGTINDIKDDYNADGLKVIQDNEAEYNDVELAATSYDILHETSKKMGFTTKARTAQRGYTLDVNLEKDHYDKWDTIKPSGAYGIPTFYFYEYYLRDLDSIKSKLIVKRDELNDVLGKELAKATNKELGFVATIERLVAILSAHVDIFYNTIKTVSSDAEMQDYRGLDKSNVLDVYKGEVYPWPGYFEETISGKYDTWLGKIMPSSVEVRYIEELLDSLIKVAKHDQELAIEFNNNTIPWYPINALELKEGMQNPYRLSVIKKTSEVDILKTIVDRLITLKLHNRFISSDEYRLVSRIEARNLFNSLLIETNENFVSGMVNFLKKIKTILTTTKKLCDNSEPYMKLIGGKYVVTKPYKYVLVNDNIENCDIIFGSELPPPALSVGREVTPLDSTGWDWYDHNKSSTASTNIEIIPTNQFSDIEFPDYDDIFSDFKNSLSFKSIIKNDISKSKQTSAEAKSIGYSIMNPSYGTQYFNEYTDGNKTETITSQCYFDRVEVLSDGTNKNITMNGYYSDFNNKTYYIDRCGVPFSEIDNDVIKGKLIKKVDFVCDLNRANYQSPGQDKGWFDTHLLENPNMREVVKDLYSGGNKVGVDNFYMPFNMFFISNPNNDNCCGVVNYTKNSNIELSLFGSDFYWSQKTDKARAFLFLNTLPIFQQYDITSRQRKFLPGILRNDILSGVLGERTGGVLLNKSWLIYLGSLIWRLMEGVDPIEWKSKSYTSSSATIHNKFAFPIGQNFNISKFPNKWTYLMDTIKCTNATQRLPSMMISDYSEIDSSNIERKYLEPAILNMPYDAKIKLRDEFLLWVADKETNVGWGNISKKLNLFNDESDADIFYSAIDAYPSSGFTPTELSAWWGTFPFNKEQYDTIIPVSTQINDHNGVILRPDGYEMHLRLKRPQDYKTGVVSVHEDLYNFLTGNKVLLNGSPHIWNRNRSEPADDAYSDLNLAGFNNYMLETSISKTDLKLYMDSFSKEYKKLKKAHDKISTKSDDAIIDSLFGDLDNESVKLSLYRSIKSIYEKWVAGSNQNNSCTLGDTDLIKSFRFIDRDFTPIGDQFLVNPTIMKTNIMGDMNQSYYDVVTRMLSDNYFDFVPLPTYIDYKNKDVLKTAFKPYPYKSEILQSISKPAFVCIYSGQKSIHLDMGPYAKFPNDGMVDGTSLEEGTPIFEVNYGDENQNYFKDISLDQEEFSETQESLKIIDDISLRGAEGNRGATGQNLFNIYNTRSYSCEIEMLGNAMIQPMMYFQLNNIPMFRGVYLIINTSHSITPNSMTTKFKGVRIRATKTPLVDESTLYMSLVGSDPTKYTGKPIRSSENMRKSKILAGSRNNFTDKEKKDTENWINPFTIANSSGSIVVSDVVRVREKAQRFHDGYDLYCNGADADKTEVCSVADGEVVTLKYHSGGGLYMVIRHTGDINNIIFHTVYMHLQHIDKSVVVDYDDDVACELTKQFMKKSIPTNNLFTSGKKVKKGQVIGLMGGGSTKKGKIHKFTYDKGGNDVKVDSAGDHSGGPHLHFEVWSGSIYTNGKKNREKNLRNPGLILPGLRENATYSNDSAAMDGYDSGYGV